MSAREARASGYEGPRQEVLDLVPRNVRSVLEFGCATGALGAGLKARQGARVVGVDVDPELVREAESRLDRAVCMDAAAFVETGLGDERFDCVICADVLEHLVDPWSVLAGAVEHLEPGGTAIVSLPNALWFQNGLRLMRERRWPREDHGPFDRTHLRWFSLSDAHDLFRGAGLTVTQTDFRYWEARPWLLPILERLSRGRLATFVAAQHIVVGSKPQL